MIAGPILQEYTGSSVIYSRQAVGGAEKEQKMTNAELREALKREIAIPHEELKFKHPTVDDIGTEFVDYTENGELTLAYPLKPEQRNGYQLLQGGLYLRIFR